MSLLPSGWQHNYPAPGPADCGPVNHVTRRRFFSSAAQWDDAYERVLVNGEGMYAIPQGLSVADIMERGGRDHSEDEEEQL